MRSRIAFLPVALALAGCAVEHGNQPARPAGGADQAAAMAPGAAPGPMHSVFARLRDTVAPGVERISLSILLAPEMDRSAQQQALDDVLDAQRKQDSSLAAIRVLGFNAPTAAHGAHPAGMAMIPFVILQWTPAAGWNAVSAANARGPHTTSVQFMADLPVHRRTPGAGAAR